MYDNLIDALNEYSVEQLEEIKQHIDKMIRDKKSSNAPEFTFEFNATSDPRKGKPYVARLYWADGKLQRAFKDLNVTWGKGEVTVSGTYTAKAGDVIEKREGGSWKNDYRWWFLVTENGEEVMVADIADSKAKNRVQYYLQGKVDAKALLEK
jgi:hypothetical protein